MKYEGSYDSFTYNHQYVIVRVHSSVASWLRGLKARDQQVSI